MGATPRWIRSDVVYSNTQRTVDRQFLFKPTPFVKNLIGASAARAQQTHPVKIYWLEFNINHEHEGIGPISDSLEHRENVVLFKKLFHRLVAEGLNREMKREGPIYSTPSKMVPCLDDVSLERQCFYSLTNPAKDGLVDRVRNWKGFSTYRQLAGGEDMVYTFHDRTAWHRCGKRKPLQAFQQRIRLELTPLPSIAHLSLTEQQRYIRREVRNLEQAYREQRAKEGRSAMTENRLEKTDQRERPQKPAKMRRLPLCHSNSVELRNEYAAQLALFLSAYKQASKRYRSGDYQTPFPPGSFRPPLIAMAA